MQLIALLLPPDHRESQREATFRGRAGWNWASMKELGARDSFKTRYLVLVVQDSDATSLLVGRAQKRIRSIPCSIALPLESRLSSSPPRCLMMRNGDELMKASKI